eukprot:CAMPEP_0172626684 /NCGR_PEP_ID=MMETSP1068-20121228/151826_1 /TAXON_ID=35684 /ORGANISM="Pseudopedinella elastica, Strain CCMP716" /LENGTH=41 /DNA_ID= /DNA_START= /DNA_END= /DNA_ORIENTATION=
MDEAQRKHSRTTTNLARDHGSLHGGLGPLKYPQKEERREEE